ncbi:hypothetical protein [Xanthomonas citri]|uniref:hypothetical protein n=1 Tax=Xanthomonas citri TaxID=346 RepID=UPI0013B3B7E4|nr:hypothetical protein [Xanthomonas citri]
MKVVEQDCIRNVRSWHHADRARPLMLSVLRIVDGCAPLPAGLASEGRACATIELRQARAVASDIGKVTLPSAAPRECVAQRDAGQVSGVGSNPVPHWLAHRSTR